MKKRRDKDARLAQAVLEALDQLPPTAAPPDRGSDTLRRRDENAAGDKWENEPDTQRYLSSGPVPAARASERRTARRVALEVAVTIDVDGDRVTGVSEDISTTGIFVRTSRLVRSGRHVQLRFDLPHGALSVTGVVVRFRTPSKETQPGIGLHFQELGDTEAECIEAFCEAASDSVRESSPDA